MKIEKIDNGNVISYDNDEWDFIDTLDEKAKRYIRMGLATVYDYGFKAEEV